MRQGSASCPGSAAPTLRAGTGARRGVSRCWTRLPWSSGRAFGSWSRGARTESAERGNGAPSAGCMRSAYSGQCTSVTTDATDRAESWRGEGGGGRGGTLTGGAGVLPSGASAVVGSGAGALRLFFTFLRRRGGSAAASGPGAEAGVPAPAMRRGAGFALLFLTCLGVASFPDGLPPSRCRVSMSRDSVSLRAKECPRGVVARRFLAGLPSGSAPRAFGLSARRRSVPVRRCCCAGSTFGRAARETPDDTSD